MKLAGKAADILAPYWAEFEGHSEYRVLLTQPNVPTCITTRTGDIAVGALFRSNASSGTLLLLPDIDFADDRFIKENEREQTWTRAAHQFAGTFVASIVALDKALRTTSEVTPEPPWASDHQYVLGPEVTLRVQLLEAERKVEQAQKEKEAVAESLASVGRFRALLFEKGKPLERCIIDALRILGFKAVPFKESDSEFDVVFECAEGRLIGEAEGKDNKAINIDKLRQLSMNIHEDLQRDEVSAPASRCSSETPFGYSPFKSGRMRLQRSVTVPRQSQILRLCLHRIYSRLFSTSLNSQIRTSLICADWHYLDLLVELSFLSFQLLSALTRLRRNSKL